MNKEIPILLSTPMVQGVHEDHKTITRRTRNLKKINISPDKWELSLTMDNWTNSKGEHQDKFAVLFTDKKSGKQISIPCPYGQAGDILWVRETWNSYNESFYGHAPKEVYLYKANGTDRTCTWKPNIHMPKAACRFRLEITGLRIERLYDITEKDAIAEGVEYKHASGGRSGYQDYEVSGLPYPQHCKAFKTAKESFQSLWKSINGKKSWDKNPWVWVVEFKKISK